MWNCTLLRGPALLLVLASSFLLHAQFQTPTEEELKMTADPKAPGAAAVYLNIEEVSNDPQHGQSFYARIKVLTEKGKELATVQIPYLKGDKKITDIKGRTIHSDGTVIPLEVKPQDMLVAKSADMQIGKVVFTLPSVEVGSILEYRYELHYADDEFSSPVWEVQRHYFVHAAHYSFTPFQAFMPRGTPGSDTTRYLQDEHGRTVNSLIWWYKLPPGVGIQTSGNGSYNLDVRDVPPIPDEEFMPPVESVLDRVIFYYKSAGNAGDFWISEGKLWSKDVDKFAETSKTIKGAVSVLIAPGDTDLDKAKKLYTAVQELENTDYTRTKSESELKQLKLKQSRHAEDTWKRKSGSSEDIAMLYLAMLRAAGLTAYASKVVDRDRGVYDPSFMDLGQFDTTIVILSTGGKEIALDPGEKMCPFQTVQWGHSMAAGIRQSSQGVSVATTSAQDSNDNATSRVGDVTVDAHGNITGAFDIAMTGQVALLWRQLALEEDEAELKKNFDHDELDAIVPEGVEAHVDHFLSLDDPYANLMAVVKVTGKLGTAQSNRLILPVFFFETRRPQPFVDETQRREPVDMRYPDRVNNEVTYHLPADMKVEGTPQDANLSWPDHSIFVTSVKSGTGQVVVSDALTNAFTLVKPIDYRDLRWFYQRVASAAQAQLVLVNTSAESSRLSSSAGPTFGGK